MMDGIPSKLILTHFADGQLVVRIELKGRACRCFADTTLAFYVPRNEEEYFRKWVMENVR